MIKDLRNDPRYKHHESRPDLAGEHPKGDLFQFILLLVFAVITILDFLIFRSMNIFPALFPFALRLIVSVAILGISAYLTLGGIRIVFGELREDPVMITEGMYSWVRHPIYLGVILIYPAVFLLTRSLLSVFAWLAGLLLYNWLAIDEEERMIAIFEGHYEEYMQNVPRWIPGHNFLSKIRSSK